MVGDRRAGAVLALLVVLAHLPAVRAGYVWDDDAYVTENVSPRSVAEQGAGS